MNTANPAANPAALVALVWAAFFTCVHRGACGWLRSGPFAAAHAALPSDKRRCECENAIPSMVHAVVSVVCAVHALHLDPQRLVGAGAEGPFRPSGSMHAYTDASLALSSFSLGYFLWDLAVTIRHSMAWTWKVHALMSILVFSLSGGVFAPPLVAWYATWWLLTETSTPFFNARMLMLSYGGARRFPTAFLVVQLLFVTTFVVVRVLWGASRTYEVFARAMSAALGVGADADAARGAFDRCALFYVALSAVALFALNCTWAAEICRAIARGKKEQRRKE